MEVKDWAVLKCDCGGDRFVAVYKLKFKTGGGTTSEPAGSRCLACQGDVDNARLIKLVEINHARRQIKELEGELGDTPEPAAAKK